MHGNRLFRFVHCLDQGKEKGKKRERKGTREKGKGNEEPGTGARASAWLAIVSWTIIDPF